MMHVVSLRSFSDGGGGVKVVGRNNKNGNCLRLWGTNVWTGEFEILSSKA